MNINIRLSKEIDKVFENFIKSQINIAVTNSPLKDLEIEEIFVTDVSTAKDLIESISPSHSYTNNDYIVGAGKSIGVQLDGKIINYLFYDVGIFEVIYNNDSSIQAKNIRNYVIHHELGHCHDHIAREEIIPPPIRNGTMFEKTLSDNYYLYSLKGELSACVFSGYAANTNLIDHQLSSLEYVYNRSFEETNRYRLDLIIYRENEIAYYNFNSALAELCWMCMVEYSKIIGYRIGNPGLKEYCIKKPRFIPMSIFNCLVNLEAEVVTLWNEYPKLSNRFDKLLIFNSDSININLRPFFAI